MRARAHLRVHTYVCAHTHACVGPHIQATQLDEANLPALHGMIHVQILQAFFFAPNL